MTIKELIVKLNKVVEMGIADENDIVVLLGSGDKQSFILNNVVVPSVKFENVEKLLSNTLESEKTGLYQVGFTKL